MEGIMPVFSRKGDDGTTGILGRQRLSKAHVRIEAYGEIDELNSLIGLVRTMHLPDEWLSRLLRIQHDLFIIGSYLATESDTVQHASLPDPPNGRVQEFESWMHDIESSTGPIKTFILPGGHPLAAWFHVLRTVCRRAERAIVRLHHHDTVPSWILQYINRLSDLFFMLARFMNKIHDCEDIPWNPS